MSNQRGGVGVIWVMPQVNWPLRVLQTISRNDRQGEPLPKGSIHLVYNIAKELHLKLAGDGKAVPHSILQG